MGQFCLVSSKYGLMEAHGDRVSSVRTCCSGAQTHVLLRPPLLGTKARIPGPQWNGTFQLKSTNGQGQLAVIIGM